MDTATPAQLKRIDFLEKQYSWAQHEYNTAETYGCRGNLLKAERSLRNASIALSSYLRSVYPG